MKIGFDARFLTHPQAGGFKTYTENLVSALAAVDRENEYVLYLDRTASGRDAVPAAPNFTTRIVTASLPLAGMPWREQVALGRQAARDRVDLLHSPCLTAPLRLACPLVLTIHDMLWLQPQKYAAGRSRKLKRTLMDVYYRVVPERAAKRAAAIITVSQSSKQSIVEQLGLDPNRIVVTYEAPAAQFRQLDRAGATLAVRQAHGLAGSFILAIGSADLRKNMATLVRAYARLPAEQREQTRLAIVWTHASLAAELKGLVHALGLTPQVRFLVRVSNDELLALYNAASLFVFPSLQEGFGLPLLEAMACGAPVVASDNSSIPEIAGGAALLVDAQDDDSMAASMRRVLTDGPLCASLVRKGLERAATFSWERCARETIGAYERALAMRRERN